MATIDPKRVKQLRDKTNAGMMDCKRALAEANGDLEEAESILRKKGISTAAKKAGREASEGVIASCIQRQGGVGVLVEINCETDFVAKNENFQKFCDEVAADLAESPDTDLEPKRIEAVAALGENILVKRSTRYELEGAGLVASYIHLQGKVGVLVEVSAGKDGIDKDEDFRQLVKDITLHIAAAHPSYVGREDVPEAETAKEREIYAAQVKDKPENIVAKIVDGKVDKYLSGICLLEQGFIKNPDETVKDLVAGVAKKLGTEIRINRFTRYQVGELS